MKKFNVIVAALALVLACLPLYACGSKTPTADNVDFVVTVACNDSKILTTVSVNVMDDLGNVVATKRPAADGKASFSLPRGNYRVELAGALDSYGYLPATLTPDAPSASVTLVELGFDEGKMCRDFTVPTYLGGGDFTLSEHRGSVVIVNLWGTWCDPCVLEMPNIQKALEEFDGVEAVAIHSAGPSRDVEQFLTETNDALDPSRTWADWNIIFAQDSGGSQLNGDVYRQLGGSGAYPLTVIVDETGIVRYRTEGRLEFEDLSAILETLTSHND